LVVDGQLVALGDEVVPGVGEFFGSPVDVVGSAGELVGVDDSGLVHVGGASAFGLGGVDASVEPVEFGGEELVVGGRGS
jgi:hypothetical protein